MLRTAWNEDSDIKEKLEILSSPGYSSKKTSGGYKKTAERKFNSTAKKTGAYKRKKY